MIEPCCCHSNDYDNVVDGCHFSRNSFGIYNVRLRLLLRTSHRRLTRRIALGQDKMANVYVRNSRFEASLHADVYLAASAGNSVRRSVSSGSAQFIAAVTW